MAFMNFIRVQLKELEKTIEKMERKRRGIFGNWLKRHNKYLKKETFFNPKTHIVYKRKMVIHVDFGFNVGAEYGGFHWAVVIQNDNQTAHTVVVVPLSSVKSGQKTHQKDAFLGKIDGLNENDAEALIGQITTISKMRIQSGNRYKLNDEQMNEIDRKIIERYVNPKLRTKFL